MSKRKKNSPSESDPKQKQACRGLKAATCDKSLKWIAKNDAELSASLWLLCEPSPDCYVLTSRFIIARFLLYNVRGPRISRGRALRIRYTGTVISS